MALRSGEKKRKSTCKFAEEIASTSLETYRKLISRLPYSSLPTRTVVAAFVSFDAKTKKFSTLTCACGTKHATDDAFDDEMKKPSTERRRVRDCHAEVLARRALKRFLLCEMIGVKEGRRTFFLEREDEEEGGRFKVREGLSLHLYVSSCPCGNATLRRWGKCGNERQWEQLDEFTLPDQTPHQAFHALDAENGQCAIALKKAIPSGEFSEQTDDATLARGTLAVGMNLKGRMVTCSDKIAMWNSKEVGVQGGLLFSKLAKPIFIQSITIGRKFSFKHCSRAFCCRLRSVGNNHPVLMQCAKVFDEQPIDTTNSNTLIFDNPNSLIWMAGKNDAEVLEKTGVSATNHGASSKFCSAAFESLFFEIFKLSNDEDKRLKYYDVAKDAAFRAFLPRRNEQTRSRRANAGKEYYL